MLGCLLFAELYYISRELCTTFGWLSVSFGFFIRLQQMKAKCKTRKNGADAIACYADADAAPTVIHVCLFYCRLSCDAFFLYRFMGLAETAVKNV